MGGRRAAGFVAELICRKPRCVLGLATGSTPLGTYAELIRMHREDGLDFSQVVTFNLDEYVGLGPDHPQSYRAFHAGASVSTTSICIRATRMSPVAWPVDFEMFCEEYERRIREVGGIDLQILGIGTDGHIAFNEPGSSLGSRTRLKTLARETVRDNARYFGSEEAVPRLAVTVGVGTILESRRCLLLATGRIESVGDPADGGGAGHGPGDGFRAAIASGSHCAAGRSGRRPIADGENITARWRVPSTCWRPAIPVRWASGAAGRVLCRRVVVRRTHISLLNAQVRHATGW